MAFSVIVADQAVITMVRRLNTMAEASSKIVGIGCAQSFYSFCYEEPHGRN